MCIAGWGSSANVEDSVKSATNILCPNVDLSDVRALQLTLSSENVAMSYNAPSGVDSSNRIYYIYISGLGPSSSLSVRPHSPFHCSLYSVLYYTVCCSVAPASAWFFSSILYTVYNLVKLYINN